MKGILDSGGGRERQNAIILIPDSPHVKHIKYRFLSLFHPGIF